MYLCSSGSYHLRVKQVMRARMRSQLIRKVHEMTVKNVQFTFLAKGLTENRRSSSGEQRYPRAFV